MSSIAVALVASSAFIIFVLGVAHLVLTFRGPKLHPRDVAVRQAMEMSPLVLTRETTMWKAWVGFNASHSLGAILFGSMYGYLAVSAPELLFHSWYLRALGLAALAGYAFLGRCYWFSVPFRGIALATGLYALGLAVGAVA